MFTLTDYIIYFSIFIPLNTVPDPNSLLISSINLSISFSVITLLFSSTKDNCTLLEVKIETGRTHQIRVHLSEIGYPLIGDEVYSNGKNKWQIKGQCLHSKSLKFKHPITGKEMYLEAKLPKYYEDLLKELRSK